jgi:predicted nucleic acid-binding protein
VTPPIVVVDTSVVLKWFHEEGEDDVAAARALLDAFAAGEVDLLVLDLTVYELGNVLVRSLKLAPEAVGTVLDALHEIVSPVALTASERGRAAELAAEHGLTFYDAAFAAVAQVRGGSLVTSDRALLNRGLGALSSPPARGGGSGG